MVIGIDFDNTLANYSGVFYQVALSIGWIPASTGKSKVEVKQYFFDNNIRDKWTELQGIVYGNEIHLAQLYHGAQNVINRLLSANHTVFIISHKTKYPVIGERVSLHLAAKEWLIKQSLVGNNDTQLKETQVFFNQTQQDKIAKITELGCDYFIDDLPTIFQHENFPESVVKIFFDPDKHYENVSFCDYHLSNWKEIAAIFL